MQTKRMNKNQKITRAEQGAVTRANILAAARQRFAADGYERATIRAIAAEADIDPSLVMRYYGNKQGLFVAAAALDLRLPDLTQVPREEAGAVLVRHFLELWEKEDTWCALLRAAASNCDAADRMRTVAVEQAVAMVAKVCDDERIALQRANLVSSQLIGFAYCRFVLQLPALTVMSRDEVIGWLGPTVQNYLFNAPPA